MKRMFPALQWLVVTLAVLLALACLTPLPIPHNQDFSVLFLSAKALLHGIPLYDYPAQLAWVRAQTHPTFELHPYPYPPWYALTTLPLALLPAPTAARMWFLLNILMIGASIGWLLPHWRASLRLFGILAAILFIPTFGLLMVGQYSAPILLGVALFLWAAQRESPLGLAAALGLMTFKPHIGLFLALAGGGWLLYRRRQAFARQALWLTLALAILLAAVGFLADARWPLTYFESLTRYRNIPGVQSCTLCASLSVGWVYQTTGKPEIARAALVSLFLGLGLLALFAWRFRSSLAQAPLLMSLAVTFTLLVDPYLLNYDYILLLIPLTLLTRQARAPFSIVTLLAAYLLPWVALAFGREGNPLLAVSTLLVLVLLWRNESLD